MSSRIVMFFWLMLFVGILACSRNEKPPKSIENVVVNNYYGVDVSDDYRYMENMDDTVFLDWMKEYAAYSRKILDDISGRSSLFDKMVEFDSRKSDKIYSLTITEDNRYFYMKRTPEDENGKLYYRDGFEGGESLVYDPNCCAEAGDINYAISWAVPTLDGETVAIGVAANGCENTALLIIDIETGEILPEVVERINGRITWLCGGDGLVYTRTNSEDVHDPQRYLDMKVYYHELGTAQSKDKLVFSSDKYPEVGMSREEIPYVMYDHDQETMFLMLYTVERYLKLLYAPCVKRNLGNVNWVTLLTPDDKVQDFYTMDDTIYLYSSKGASNFQILKTSISNPDISNASMVVQEHKKGIISGYSFTNEGMYYKLKFNGVEEKLYRLAKGESVAKEIELPVKAGSVWISTRGHKFSDIWLTLSGWTLDSRRYRYQALDHTFELEQMSSVAKFPEFSDLIVEELMIPSHDGVEVPLSLIYKKGTRLDGTAPLMITGYGAYGVSRSAAFSPYSLLWTAQGGIMAVAHVRGGGEMGDAWHRAGQKTTKPNTWKDVIACTEYLIENKYSASKHIAIYGASAGGVMAGRALTERPDLFAAVIPAVGVMNPLRAEESPNGPVNSPEFGTVKDSMECMSLIAMDSYQSIIDGIKYPATLVTAGFNDPRVIVWQPAKFAARLQKANSSKNPILFDVDYSSGHGVGDKKTSDFEGLADVLAFALWQTGHPEFQK